MSQSKGTPAPDSPRDRPGDAPGAGGTVWLGRPGAAGSPRARREGPAPTSEDPPGTGRLAGPHAGATPFPEPGDELFGYLVRDELGRGAFARVFLAEQGDLAGRPVVLKVSAI